MGMFARKCSALVLAILLIVPAAAAAQAGSAGRLTGVVKDAQGAVIPGASVVTTADKAGAEFRATSDGSGTWTMDRIPAGTYTVTVSAPSTVPAVLKGVVVGARGDAKADAVLKVGISETVVVTASRVEELQVDAPAPVTIIGARTIEAQPTQDYADLMRQVPGVNVVQMSARDFNVTPRGATNTPASSQLVMIDGRPINQDYYGYVAWDFMPNALGELKQVEVLRGAASAVWGAYAMNGVVNILTKSPREMAGTTVTMGGGTFDRDNGTNNADAGSLYYVNASHAQALNERWAYKLSAGYFKTDALARPTGTIANAFNTPYPPYENLGTKQPKVDGRVDYDSPDGVHHLSLSGGYAGTGGAFHTGLGPFRLEDNARGSYGKVDYRSRGWWVKSFVNLWHGEAKHRQFSMRASPAAAGLERLYRALARIIDEEKDVDEKLWALLEAFGFLAKTPVGARQVSRTGRYVTSGGLAEDLEAGELGQVLSGLVYGERDRQPLNPFTATEE